MQRDQTAVTYLHTLIRTLTAGVYESVDGVGQEADTAQKTSALLFVNLLVVPYTDGDGVCFSNISGRGWYQAKKVSTQKTAFIFFKQKKVWWNMTLTHHPNKNTVGESNEHNKYNKPTTIWHLALTVYSGRLNQ